jgi:hypothetical protein
MIDKPKKERRFLKALGRVGEILIQEVLLKVGSNLIKRIGGKKTLPSILFLFLSISLFAQYPTNPNKQRLGFQTTADGLVWRGSISDTASIQPVSNQNAWVILDTVNLKLYSFDFTSNVWNQLPSGSTVDTTSLSNRINLKLNISDTAAMLLPYAKKSYVDTAGRFYARQDFTNVSSSTLNWTQTDTLVPAGVNVVQVYRNGQILLPTQYTIPTNASVVIGATAFKLGENYTVIFPKGGGGSGSGGSGSLTSISGGTGITVSPDPITTTGTVSADLTVLMELSDTVTLSNRINNKVNISDTLTMLLPYFRDADTSLLNLTSRFALKLNAADTASLSSRINTKGTVSSVATGFGLLGGTITTTGTLLLDSAVVFTRIRDSIVDVAIGNDTIKILKQEYAPATTSVLTWTITPKFPIQLKAYILVFRNGQLLNNDQYNLTDTNKITIVSTSFKVGANYTVATVSGIGSIGTGVFPNPVYPEAGIALSTGSAWASSIPNNSNNWNIAYNDKINNAAFTGTTTKTLTLTQLDGGTITAPFTDLQGIVAGDTASMLLPYLRRADTTSMLLPYLRRADTTLMLTPYLRKADTTNMLLPYFRDADTTSLNLISRFAAKQNTLTNPVTGTGTTNTLPLFTGTSTLGNSVIQESSGNIGINTTPFASLTLGQGKNIMLDASLNNVPRLLFYETNARNENDVQFGAKIQYNSPSDRLEFIMRDSFAADPSGDELAISIVRQTGNVTIHKPTTLSSTLAVTGDITENGNNVLTSADTTTMLAPYIERGDTATMLNPYWRSGRFSGTLPIANGGTGAESASVARTTLAVGYLFIEVTAGTVATLTSNRVSLVNTGGSLTTQLDLTTATNGRMYMIKNLASGTIVSTASNVIPFNGGSAGTAILGAGNVTPQWCTLVADGTNWHIMQRN